MFVVLVLVAGSGVRAQTVAPAHGAAAAAKTDSAEKTPDKMIVEADELVQNNDANTVAASGNVRIYYQGKTLQADKVIYNKTTKRLFAEGHAKLTEKDGTVVYGDRFDLTDNFRDGFVDSLRAETKQQTHFSAPRAERTSGAGPDNETTVYERGTYTACALCKEDPSRPPLWQVRAKRIIHKKQEQMVYFEDAYLEFLGVPLAYVPFYSTPDPDVTRKSGILSPTELYRSALGYGVGLPVFFNLAPNYDLTLTPTVFTSQGFFGAGEFRQRFENGMYYIKASGIDETDPSVFANPPYGSSNRRFRGDVQTKGDFDLNEEWKFGWDIIALSDKYYLQDFAVHSPTTSANYFSESISTIYLTGQGQRSYFDLRGYYIEGLSAQDIQTQQPVVHPVLDYNHTFDIDPAKSNGIGGQLEFDFNFTSISATTASFQSVGAQTLDSAYGLYNVCNTYLPGKTPGTSCLLRSIGGDYNRATAQLTYQRKYIDPLGEVWTPFAFVHVNAEDLSLNTTNSHTFSNGGSSSTILNSSQNAFVSQGASGYVTPALGLEYRYPILATTSFASIIFEPIVQVIARPSDQIGTQSMLNIDSQSLVFDNSNLFDWNKYSGYDQFETGTRSNYGAQLSMNFKNGGYASFVAGQSAQLAGKNSYATADAANVGLSSGLDTRRSDYVAGATVAPASFISFAANSRFDVDTLEPRRIDVVTNLHIGSFNGGIQFARYTAQPLIGYNVTREGLSLNGKYDFMKNYFVKGNVTFDMSRQFYPIALTGDIESGSFPIAAMGLGAGYVDGCTTFSVTYTSVYQNNGTGTLNRNQTYLLSLELKTLGDSRFSQADATPAPSTVDGIK
ncbi:MAG: LPS-assembly protein LptD [Beijerinckiaceae bacterium]|nr:LPS-assembly protein LptD [Beijerinckiaceae bacterium]